MVATNTSPNLYQRLHKAMQAVAYVQKEDKKVNNQYTFVSHDAVTAAVRKPLLEAGIVYHTSVKEHKQDGNRTETVVTVTFVNIDNPEDRLSVDSLGYGVDPSDKGPGKAVSYAVKYALLKTLGLETGDDPERDDIKHEPAPKKYTPDQIRDMAYQDAPEETWTGYVNKIDKVATNPKSMWHVTVGIHQGELEGGRVFKTTNPNLWKKAEEFRTSGERVAVTYQHTSQGDGLRGIALAELVEEPARA